MSCLNCKSCGSEIFKLQSKTFSNGSLHTQAVCAECEAPFMFLKTVSNEEFKMPFGKYEGQLLTKIAEIDKSYLRWVAETANVGNNMKKRAQELLSI